MRGYYVMREIIDDDGFIKYEVTACSSKSQAIKICDKVYEKNNRQYDCYVVAQTYVPLNIKVNTVGKNGEIKHV